MEVDKFVEESLKMSRFKHAHVMGLIGVCLDAGPAPYIVMPYMANGSLLQYLRRERKNLVFVEGTDDDEVTIAFNQNKIDYHIGLHFRCWKYASV